MRGNFVLQDILLNQMRRERSLARIIAINGVEFRGKIHGFDNETIILDLLDGNQLMLYKKNLLSIMPPSPVLIDPSDDFSQ